MQSKNNILLLPVLQFTKGQVSNFLLSVHTNFKYYNFINYE